MRTGSRIGGVTTWAIAALVASACGNGQPAAPAALGTPTSSTSPQTSVTVPSAATDSLKPAPDPCSFVTAAEVSAIVGELSGPPRRGRSFDRSEPSETGRACVYTIKTPALGELIPSLSVEMRTDAVGHELGFHIGQQMGRNLAKQLGWSSPPSNESEAPSDDGWDFRGAWPNEYFGRLGSVGVSIGIEGFERTPWQAVAKLAALVRDRVPDRPFASENEHASREPDPCTLLTTSDVEPIAGRLLFPPYRSEDATPLASTRGAGCSYYFEKHHVLTIHPQWSQGKQLFAMLSRTNSFAEKAVGLPPASEGALFGSWDQAGERPDGALLLLKGDRMLTVSYRGTKLSREDSLKLAEVAVQRLDR